jgi:hypothetical protein
VLPLSSACSSSPSGPQTVIEAPDGFSVSGPAHVDEIMDAGLPDLNNVSDHAVRLRSVQLVGVPRAVQVLSVRAYNIERVGYGGVGLGVGDPVADCPQQFVAAPISSFTIPPHERPGWMVVIEFRITRPGTYLLKRVKIRYSTSGGTGWQYQYLNLTLYVAEPPRPGLNPDPGNNLCGRPDLSNG